MAGELKKKVLIFGDNPMHSATLSLELEKLEYEIQVFDLYTSGNNVTDYIKARVKETQPDYAIFGRLDGQYIEAIAKAREVRKGLKCILCTDNEQIVRPAKKEGHADKVFLMMDELGGLIEFMKG